MIAAASITDNFMLYSPLLAMHRQSIEWLSAAVLWKQELVFFQKLLDRFMPKCVSDEEKKRIEHFQNVIIYYKCELIDATTARVRSHERNLAKLLEQDQTKTTYVSEHNNLMNDLESIERQFIKNKTELYTFIEAFM